MPTRTHARSSSLAIGAHGITRIRFTTNYEILRITTALASIRGRPNPPGITVTRDYGDAPANTSMCKVSVAKALMGRKKVIAVASL